jgi:hypothetical protein
MNMVIFNVMLCSQRWICPNTKNKYSPIEDIMDHSKEA